MNTEDKIVKWTRLSSQLKKIKKQEMELRVDIVDSLVTGTQACTYHINNHGIKITLKNSVSVIADNFQEKYNLMTKVEKDCFKMKPSLILSKYKEIESDAIDAVLVSKPAAPTISIISTKGE